MTCKAAVSMICNYLEDTLSPNAGRALGQHLEQCKNCTLVVDAAQRTLEIYFDREDDAVMTSRLRAAWTAAQ